MVSMGERLGLLENHPTLAGYLVRNEARSAFVSARAVE
jgi:2-oxo-4-hydroxy-4-carboxy--5-ureidoimidazoline (OHCU) decarboxylase